MLEEFFTELIRRLCHDLHAYVFIHDCISNFLVLLEANAEVATRGEGLTFVFDALDYLEQLLLFFYLHCTTHPQDGFRLKWIELEFAHDF